MIKKKKAIIVDLDGTLFKDIYSKFIPETISNETWQEFHKKVDHYKDVPVDEAIFTVCENMFLKGFKIIFLTAREKESLIYHNTRMALYNLFPTFKNNYELIMRDIEDKRPACEMKRDMIETYILPKYEILFAIDDCPRNIKMFKDFEIATMEYCCG